MQPLTIDLPEATGRNRPAATGTPRAFTRRWPYVAGGGLVLALAVAPCRGRGRGHARHQAAPGDRRRARPGMGRGGLGGADGRDDPPPGTARPVGDRRGRA